MTETPRKGRLIVLVFWYLAWAAVGILLAKPGLIGMFLAVGAGVVAFLLMEVFVSGNIGGPHLIAAIFVAVIAHGVARVIGVLLFAGAV
ncbi:MAG: hypothetical protein C0606_16215 [Hyphomicrobiales bacterium]|nr:MAG: hypothetical protein C0606_16215 [Hyphomicrobiales bacterium]